MRVFEQDEAYRDIDEASLPKIDGLSEWMLKLLYVRGVRDETAIEEFFNPSLSSLYDPMLFLDMDMVVARIKLAIENTSFTLWQSRVLVIGFGRVGKVLADRLKGLGAYVTVSARKPSDFALIKALGYNAVETRTVSDSLSDYDIVFNTVDVKVIDERVFENCSVKLLIDLSSKGGFDLPAARDCGIHALTAPGLPGLCAPLTAGKILAETVTEILSLYI